jgi:hypothetical protein
MFRRIKPATHAIDEVEALLVEEGRTGFARFAGLSNTIEGHYKTMKEFIAALPGAQV